MIVRHLTTAGDVADQVGLSADRFAAIVRYLTAMRSLMADDPAGTLEVVARATGAGVDQVDHVWRAWCAPDSA